MDTINKNTLLELIKKYPNDTELGREIRKKFAVRNELTDWDDYKKLKDNTHCKIMLKNGSVIITTIIDNDISGKQITCEYHYGYNKEVVLGYEDIKKIKLI